ncbi:universal stress protein [Streptomyces sp. NBC_00523]|uniref:universal stress protein n=1 Tax=unclassified Streptomyces TaxID=2593676 RepID=UPI002E81F952|nr:universal stress protein [Streptomyces sp. NBC_00523]WUC98280.1 universal stress protein [Streptomyces sp. NBC_00523]
MSSTTEHREIVVGIDPSRDWRLTVAWAADEAHRRHRALRLVVAVPPQHDTHHVDDTPRHTVRALEGKDAVSAAAEWARERRPGTGIATAVVDGFPAQVMARLAQDAAMVVLGSRHLSRTEEYLSAGALVVPVTAQARCPVVVVGEAEHSTQEPPYLVVGVDGSESSLAALAFAAQEADLRRAELRAVAVWQPPVFSLRSSDTMFEAERRQLSEITAGWSEKYPGLRLTHEVRVGSPVEILAEAGEHALALVVGRRGRGGYTGMRVGSVVHGLLHRARCPVVTVPVR